jgi:hypothetical protein
LLLALFGRAAVCFPAADDAAVTVADASAETSENLAVLVAPPPDAEWC